MGKKLQATSVQDQTWIVSDLGQRLGLLSKQGDSTYVFLGKGAQTQVNTIQELEAQLKGQIHWEKPKAEPDTVKQTHVHNLPIKHDSAVDVQLMPMVTYKKTDTSETRFAAGYWILKFSTGWSGSLSPKLATLQEYEHLGVFSSKLEMNTMLAQKNAEFKRKN